MTKARTSKPSWSLHLHETVGKIEKRTRECLQDCVDDDFAVAAFLLDLDKVTQIMRASARESFTARVEYCQSHQDFSQKWLDELLDETIAATLRQIPMAVRLFNSGYRKSELAIREALNTDLRVFLEQRSKGQLTNPADTRKGAVSASDPGDMVGGDPTVRTSKGHCKIVNKRRNSRYLAIDQALRSIAEALPSKHEEVFQFLDERNVVIPNRRPFRPAGGWRKGFQRDPRAASVWLSQAWGRLGLPAFQRGPKK